MRSACDCPGSLPRHSFLTGVERAEVQAQHSGHTMLRGQRSEFLAAKKTGICRVEYRREVCRQGPHKLMAEGWVYSSGQDTHDFLDSSYYKGVSKR